MRITPELVANLIFASSQLRYFEQVFQVDPDVQVKDIIIRYQCKVDDVLCKMGMEMHMSRQQIIDIIKLETNEVTT